MKTTQFFAIAKNMQNWSNTWSQVSAVNWIDVSACNNPQLSYGKKHFCTENWIIRFCEDVGQCRREDNPHSLSFATRFRLLLFFCHFWPKPTKPKYPSWTLVSLSEAWRTFEAHVWSFHFLHQIYFIQHWHDKDPTGKVWVWLRFAPSVSNVSSNILNLLQQLFWCPLRERHAK